MHVQQQHSQEGDQQFVPHKKQTRLPTMADAPFTQTGQKKLVPHEALRMVEQVMEFSQHYYSLLKESKEELGSFQPLIDSYCNRLRTVEKRLRQGDERLKDNQVMKRSTPAKTKSSNAVQNFGLLNLTEILLHQF